jgi:hypothetical protein
MDEDEKEMLSEARARMANTVGKKVLLSDFYFFFLFGFFLYKITKIIKRLKGKRERNNCRKLGV